MSNSSYTLTYSTPVPSNESLIFYCGNNGIMEDSIPGPLRAYYACGMEYESALATLTKQMPGTTFSANMHTSSDTILYCGFSSTIDPSKNNSSPFDSWNCGRTYARSYALSDALSLKPTNVLQYFIFALFITCIIL